MLCTGDFRILSLGQFRPEKDHPRQIRALARLRDLLMEEPGVSEREREARWDSVRLVLAGGVRNVEFKVRKGLVQSRL